MNVYAKQKQTHRYKKTKPVVTKGEREGRGQVRHMGLRDVYEIDKQ